MRGVRHVAPGGGDDGEGLRQAEVDTDTERPAWEAAVKQLAGGAAPRLDDTIRLYVDTYHVMLDGIDATDSWPAFSQKVDLTQLQDLPGKVTSLNIEARTRCL